MYVYTYYDIIKLSVLCIGMLNRWEGREVVYLKKSYFDQIGIETTTLSLSTNEHDQACHYIVTHML